MRDGYNKKGLCKLCKEPRTERRHDPCIANLPGVLYACCGHGIEDGYIKFEDGRTLNFTPIEMELDCPKHMWVRNPVPIRVRGDEYSVLKFKSGKKKIKKPQNVMMERNGWKLIRGSD
jgi:hypothetical protein